jgi:serralysin
VRKRSAVLVIGALVSAPGVLALEGAAAATGSTVWVENGYNTYFRGGDEANNLVVTDTLVGEWERTYRFDDVVPLTPGEGCARPDAADPTVVECEIHDQPTNENNLDVRLGGGNDVAVVDDLYGMNILAGGAGNDRLSGTDVDLMYGDAGDDRLFARGITDGGPGNDTMTGAGLQRGGDGNDHITGNGVGNDLYGGRGNDTILGEGGKDIVYGNSGRDLIRGGTESDKLYGGPDGDTIYGNSGNDLLEGGPGRDTLSGGPGRDTVRQ